MSTHTLAKLISEGIGGEGWKRVGHTLPVLYRDTKWAAEEGDVSRERELWVVLRRVAEQQL